MEHNIQMDLSDLDYLLRCNHPEVHQAHLLPEGMVVLVNPNWDPNSFHHNFYMNLHIFEILIHPLHHSPPVDLVEYNCMGNSEDLDFLYTRLWRCLRYMYCMFLFDDMLVKYCSVGLEEGTSPKEKAYHNHLDLDQSKVGW